MLQDMKAIEYNWLESMIDYVANGISIYAPTYNLGGVSVDVIPAYPKDLTKFKKPSIIVQKVGTMKGTVGVGNVLGSYTDPDTNAIYDVYGNKFTQITQVDVVAVNRTQLSLITAMICEKILSRFDDNGDRKCITLSDYTINEDSPVPMGVIDIVGEIEVTDMDLSKQIQTTASENDDYRSIIRFDTRVIQHIINPDQAMVDLSKPIKLNQTTI